jgi:hypothetical protein
MIVTVVNDNLVFNWEELPDNIKIKSELKNKIFKELQLQFDPKKLLVLDSKELFKMNKFVLDRIKSVIKSEGV